MEPRSERLGSIYFIEAVGIDRVKIGFSQDVPKRLRKLQASSPVPLRVIKQVQGSIESEQVLIRVFEKYRVHGEWFERAPLQAFIDSLFPGEEFSPEMIFKK